MSRLTCQNIRSDKAKDHEEDDNDYRYCYGVSETYIEEGNENIQGFNLYDQETSCLGMFQ